MKRPELHRISLSETILSGLRPSVTVTMSTDQWDSYLAAAYDTGCVLLELDHNEVPVAAYQRQLRS